jgi:hypothetical protein
MGEKRNEYMVLVGKPEGKRPLGILGCVWLILKWILDKYGEIVWTALIWLRIGVNSG